MTATRPASSAETVRSAKCSKTCLGHGDNSAAPPTEEELLSEFALELADVPDRTLVEAYLAVYPTKAP